ncbi:MAG TPA: MarR family transcriptional regulator [Actinomycetota bacterium]|nr:MarR family transcriptional regulator [Actinomycetota bacterium]
MESNDPSGAAEALFRLLAAVVVRTSREISLTALSTLATLERAGPRRITELAASEGVAQPSMTAVVTALERSGLVARRRDAGDQRVVLVELTGGGAGYLCARRQAGADTFARLIGQLSRPDADALRAALPALQTLAALADEERPPTRREARLAGAGVPAEVPA